MTARFPLALAVATLVLVALTACLPLRLRTDADQPAAPTSSPAPTYTVDPDDSHTDEAEFIGVVTGYENPEGDYGFGCDVTNCIAVDHAAVNLAMIDTWEFSCIEPSGLNRDTAITAKQDALPIGTVVRVVRNGTPGQSSYNYGGFIHVVNEATGVAAETSVNEQLVAGGFWVPLYTWSNSDLIGNPYAETTIYAAKDTLYTEVEAEYAPHLIDAANAARTQAIGGQAICVQQLADKAEADAAFWAWYAESVRQGDLWYANWLKEHPGGVTCRDGDGDGVCYER